MLSRHCVAQRKGLGLIQLIIDYGTSRALARVVEAADKALQMGGPHVFAVGGWRALIYPLITPPFPQLLRRMCRFRWSFLAKPLLQTLHLCLLSTPFFLVWLASMWRLMSRGKAVRMKHGACSLSRQGQRTGFIWLLRCFLHRSLA